MGTEMVGAVATAAAAIVGGFVSLLGLVRTWREQERLARKGEIERLERALETRDLWIEDLRASLRELDDLYTRERTAWRKERAALHQEIDAVRTELEGVKNGKAESGEHKAEGRQPDRGEEV